MWEVVSHTLTLSLTHPPTLSHLHLSYSPMQALQGFQQGSISSRANRQGGGTGAEAYRLRRAYP